MGHAAFRPGSGEGGAEHSAMFWVFCVAESAKNVAMSFFFRSNTGVHVCEGESPLVQHLRRQNRFSLAK